MPPKAWLNFHEIQPAVPDQVFANRAIAELQQLSSLEADHLGRLSYPMILRAGKSHYERISWNERYEQEPR